MDRKLFSEVCGNALEEVLDLAEKEGNQKFSGDPCIRIWPEGQTIRECVVDRLVALIYKGPELIHPCVDIGVAEITEDQRPIIFVIKSGHSHRKYTERSWSGRTGPFNYFLIGEVQKEGTLTESLRFSITKAE